MRVSILGGTGKMGRGLASGLAENNEVRIGSRDPVKARVAATGLPGVKGESNSDAASWCEAAIVSVPFDAIPSLKELAPSLEGKLVISIINPLRSEAGVLQYASKGISAAELVASTLPLSSVATAFNNVPVSFFGVRQGRDVDILVAADSRETYERAAKLVRSIPWMRPLYVGPLSQAESVERVTVLVLNAAALNGGPKLSVKFVK